MSEYEALAALGLRLGVAPGYHDIWGTWHAASEATLRAVLAAMGLDVADEPAVLRSLGREEAAAWERTLPPVCVVPSGAQPQLAMVLAAHDSGGAIRWRIEEEDGSTHAGEVNGVEVVEERVVEGARLARATLRLPPISTPGYHDLSVEWGLPRSVAKTRLIVVPERCYLPPALAGGKRAWGVAIQLYGLRSRRGWGIGDFTDLQVAVEVLAGLGADLIGVNPLHALYPYSPGDASPYSPSSRSFLNVLYLDVEGVPDHGESEHAVAAAAAAGFQARIEQARRAELVDYDAVAALKLEALERAYTSFRSRHLETGSARARAFREFQTGGGEALRSLALFEAMATRRGSGAAPVGAPGSPETAAFLAANATLVEFHEYLQWQCAEQLDAVARQASALGMEIGLYMDLAVGADRRGAEVWGGPELFAQGVSAGAPPDDFSLSGQSWGLPPWRPASLFDAAYEPFVRTLRAGMQAAGAMRVDHVVGLMRLFWVPDGAAAVDGAYVGYRLDDLLGIVALESERHRCLVVGEDLGTVPDEMRSALHERGLLSYKVLYFEKHWHGDRSFKHPHEMPADALVTVSTHDLPTFAGYWAGADIALRDDLGLLPCAQTRRNLEQTRAQDRHGLLWVLGEHGLHPGGVDADDPRPAPAGLGLAVQRYLARSPARVMVAQMEDVLGLTEQANLPGTIDEQPNWRRRLPLALEDWADDPRLTALAEALNVERGRGT